MKSPMHTMDEYRTQITRFTHALARAQHGDILKGMNLAGGTARVKLFTDGNLDKRFLKLKDLLEYAADGFEDLDDRIARFVQTMPLQPYDSNCSDSERFLDWLSAEYTLTDGERDCVTCQRSRNAVEQLAEENRLAHVRFQEICSVSPGLAPAWGTEGVVRLHPNPIHVAATFHTRELLDEEDDVPASVMFFPVGNEVRTAVLEEEGRRIAAALKNAGPLRFDDLAAVEPSLDRETLVEVSRDLAEVGLAAFA